MHELVAKAAAFYPPWLAAAAVASEQPGAPAGALMITFDGLALPVVQLVLALAGVLMARPLAPRRTPPLGWPKSLLVTVIMLVIAAAWVIEAHPGLLFTFVVAIGLGFSGYTLIELIGTEVQSFVKRVFETALGTIDNILGKKK